MKENGNHCGNQQWSNCRSRNMGMHRGCMNSRMRIDSRNDGTTKCYREENEHICYGEMEPVDRMRIGIGYVPWQKFENVMEAEEGLMHGTIFQELVMPYCGKPVGRGGEK